MSDKKEPQNPRKPRDTRAKRVEPTLGTPETPPATEASAEVTVTVEASSSGNKADKPAKPRVRVKAGETAEDAVKRERRKVLFSKSDIKSLGDAGEEIVTRGGRPIFRWLLILILVFFGGWAAKEIISSWLSRKPPAAHAPTVTVNPPQVTVNPADVNVTVNPPAAPEKAPQAEVAAPPPPRNNNQDPRQTPPRQAAPPRNPPRQASPPRAAVPPAISESLRPPGMTTPPGEQGASPPRSPASPQETKADCLTERPFPRQFPDDLVRYDFKGRQMCYETSANNPYHPPTGCIPYAQLSTAQKRVFDQYAARYAK